MSHFLLAERHLSYLDKQEHIQLRRKKGIKILPPKELDSNCQQIACTHTTAVNIVMIFLKCILKPEYFSLLSLSLQCNAVKTI